MKIPLDMISEALHTVRSVDKESQDFLDMVDSVRKSGVKLPIIVRPMGGEEYELVDGAHRYYAACEAGLEEIEAQVENLSDSAALETSIEMNAQRVEMRPAAYGKSIKRLLEHHPERTLSEQAKRLNKSPSWLQKVLKVSNLEGEAERLVDAGRISLGNAELLSRLVSKGEDIEPHLEAAERLSVEKFGETIRDLLKTGGRIKVRPADLIDAEYTRAAADPNTHPAYTQALAWVLNKDVNLKEVLINE